MRAYRNLLKYLSETDPRQLSALPHPFLLEEANWLLRHDEIRVLERVDRFVPVIEDLPAADLAAATRTALDKGAVDEFCFLYTYLPPVDRPDPTRIDAACARLARRGNAAGIEQIIATTDIHPVLDRATVLRCYDVLVSAGRLGAVEYIRRLSCVPVRFDPHAVATGVRTLLAGGQYEALRKLLHKADQHPVPLTSQDMDRAVGHALDDGALCELAGALLALETPHQVEGFAAAFDRLVTEDRFGEIPALFVLYADADWGVLDGGMWSRLIASGSPDTVRFAYESCDDRAWLGRHADAAYRLGVESADRTLVRLVCERGGGVLRPGDTAPLLDDALEHGDVAWVDFAVGRLGTLPLVDGDRAQLHLARQARHRPERVASDAVLLGVEPDETSGQSLLDLADGRFENVSAAVARIGAAHRGARAGSAPATQVLHRFSTVAQKERT